VAGATAAGVALDGLRGGGGSDGFVARLRLSDGRRGGAADGPSQALAAGGAAAGGAAARAWSAAPAEGDWADVVQLRFEAAETLAAEGRRAVTVAVLRSPAACGAVSVRYSVSAPANGSLTAL
jgi:hypothetical protein